jgi:hypothetical protein
MDLSKLPKSFDTIDYQDKMDACFEKASLVTKERNAIIKENEISCPSLLNASTLYFETERCLGYSEGKERKEHITSNPLLDPSTSIFNYLPPPRLDGGQSLMFGIEVEREYGIWDKEHSLPNSYRSKGGKQRVNTFSEIIDATIETHVASTNNLKYISTLFRMIVSTLLYIRQNWHKTVELVNSRIDETKAHFTEKMDMLECQLIEGNVNHMSSMADINREREEDKTEFRAVIDRKNSEIKQLTDKMNRLQDQLIEGNVNHISLMADINRQREEDKKEFRAVIEGLTSRMDRDREELLELRSVLNQLSLSNISKQTSHTPVLYNPFD